ncbi:hypothetical protein CBD41_07000 [bacterium TMED181]|nr:hypothetical protein [Planctomycetota bacterium]OUW43573.1 MAG: hypothetical protein CBD41_07000 [bacterium TMED181]
MKISIIGGSIAGLAAAIRLQRSGHEVHVWERRQEFSPGGFGMILNEKSKSTLQKLDIEVSEISHSVKRYFVDDLSKGLQHEQSIPESFGIERKLLVQKLRSKLKTGTLHFGSQFDHFGYKANGSAQYARFKNGQQVNADLFIGADGIRSRVREQHLPGTPLNAVKTAEVVGISHFNETPDALRGSFVKYLKSRDGLAMGMVPTAHHNVVWYFQCDIQRWPQVFQNPNSRITWLDRELASWPRFVQNIVRKGGLENSHLWRTTDRNLPQSFHRKNVVLVGDAAHPLLTFTSQGIGSALEDSEILGEILDAENPTTPCTLDHCLMQYFSRRKTILQHRLYGGRKLQNQFLNQEPDGLKTVPVCA